jgi:hypothetical protein
MLPAGLRRNSDAAAINQIYNSAHPAPMFDRFKFPYLHDIQTGYVTLNNICQLRELGRRKVMYVQHIGAAHP